MNNEMKKLKKVLEQHTKMTYARLKKLDLLHSEAKRDKPTIKTPITQKG